MTPSFPSLPELIVPDGRDDDASLEDRAMHHGPAGECVDENVRIALGSCETLRDAEVVILADGSVARELESENIVVCSFEVSDIHAFRTESRVFFINRVGPHNPENHDDEAKGPILVQQTMSKACHIQFFLLWGRAGVIKSLFQRVHHVRKEDKFEIVRGGPFDRSRTNKSTWPNVAGLEKRPR